MAISREDIAAVLDEIALLLEIKGENPFKTRAYRNGAETVRNFQGEIVAMAAANNLEGIKGIGAALQQGTNFMNVARNAAVRAGLPVSVAGQSIGQFPGFGPGFPFIVRENYMRVFPPGIFPQENGYLVPFGGAYITGLTKMNLS